MIRDKQFVSPTFVMKAGVTHANHTRHFTGDQARCHYCGRATFDHRTPEAHSVPKATRTVDHKWPRAHGGTNATCVVACTCCNGLKGDTPYELFCAWFRLPGADSWNNRAEISYRRFVFDCARAGLEAARQLARWTKEEAEIGVERERHREAVAAAYEQFRGSRMRAAS
jgi:hypothetical protein